MPLQYNTEQTRRAIKQEKKKRMKSIDFVRKPVLFSGRILSSFFSILQGDRDADITQSEERFHPGRILIGDMAEPGISPGI